MYRYGFAQPGETRRTAKSGAASTGESVRRCAIPATCCRAYTSSCRIITMEAFSFVRVPRSACTALVRQRIATSGCYRQNANEHLWQSTAPPDLCLGPYRGDWMTTVAVLQSYLIRRRLQSYRMDRITRRGNAWHVPRHRSTTLCSSAPQTILRALWSVQRRGTRGWRKRHRLGLWVLPEPSPPARSMVVAPARIGRPTGARPENCIQPISVRRKR